MAPSGIQTVDDLISGQSQNSITVNNAPRDAVGIVQDLLAGVGVSGMPSLLSPAYGSYGPVTRGAVQTFQRTHNLPSAASVNDVAVDGATLNALVNEPATAPAATRAYLTLVLGFPFTGMLRVMSVTTIFEGGGRFTAQNRNTDRAGLSFGLIQWAQRPRRLNELLRAFQSAQPQLFVQIFGGGNATVAQGLINHTGGQGGGTNSSGNTTNPAFNLIQEPWTSRFRQAALDRSLQRVQVSTALAAFDDSFQRLTAFAPRIRSERGVAFMLDLANQFGDGGARSVFQAVNSASLTEPELLLAVENESVRRVGLQFGANSPEAASTRNRRRAFRTTPLLSDQPFDPD